MTIELAALGTLHLTMGESIRIPNSPAGMPRSGGGEPRSLRGALGSSGKVIGVESREGSSGGISLARPDEKAWS